MRGRRDIKMYVISLILICAVVAANARNHDMYSGFTVHGIKLRDRSDQELIKELQTSADVDVWQYGYPGDRDSMLMLTPDNRDQTLEKFDSVGLTHYLQIADIAKSLEEHDEQMTQWRMSKSRNGRMVPFEDYPRYDAVDAYLERIVAQYPNIVTLVNAGQSFEGRAIKYLKISTTNFNDTSKPIYFMEATIHAREWVTTPVALYSIHRLVEDLRDQDRDLLEDTDWIILPIVNPDGYEYSHTTERLWRRTRSYRPEINETCYGVDANRNFDVNFNTSGVSSDPCSNTYPGHQAFSEPETAIVRDILLEYIDRIQMFNDVHSFGNWMLFGFGNETLPANAVHLYNVGATLGAVIDALKLPKADHYKVGNSAMLLYGSSGSAQDYGQAVGVPFSYTLELPGYEYMFQVPPQYIEQIITETWAGIAATARLCRTYYQARL